MPVIIQNPSDAKAMLTVQPFVNWGFSVDGNLNVSMALPDVNATYRKAAARDRH